MVALKKGNFRLFCTKITFHKIQNHKNHNPKSLPLATHFRPKHTKRPKTENHPTIPFYTFCRIAHFCQPLHTRPQNGHICHYFSTLDLQSRRFRAFWGSGNRRRGYTCFSAFFAFFWRRGVFCGGVFYRVPFFGRQLPHFHSPSALKTPFVDPPLP